MFTEHAVPMGSIVYLIFLNRKNLIRPLVSFRVKSRMRVSLKTTSETAYGAAMLR